MIFLPFRGKVSFASSQLPAGVSFILLFVFLPLFFRPLWRSLASREDELVGWYNPPAPDFSLPFTRGVCFAVAEFFESLGWRFCPAGAALPYFSFAPASDVLASRFWIFLDSNPGLFALGASILKILLSPLVVPPFAQASARGIA